VKRLKDVIERNKKENTQEEKNSGDRFRK